MCGIDPQAICDVVVHSIPDGPLYVDAGSNFFLVLESVIIVFLICLFLYHGH